MKVSERVRIEMAELVGVAEEEAAKCEAATAAEIASDMIHRLTGNTEAAEQVAYAIRSRHRQ